MPGFRLFPSGIAVLVLIHWATKNHGLEQKWVFPSERMVYTQKEYGRDSHGAVIELVQLDNPTPMVWIFEHPLLMLNGINENSHFSV